MRARIRIALLAVCVLLALPGRAAAIELQAVGAFDEPIYVTSPPGDPRLFVVERAGRIQVLHDGTKSQFFDIHTMVDTGGERGLLSLAFDPSYAANGLFYVFFNDNGTAGAPLGDIHVDEFSVSGDPNVADPGSRRRVLTVNRGTTASNHNGGQLQFGKDGLLYISVGDAANGSNAQNPANLNGKILRIDPHGGGPEVWSLGLRNPWRFSFDHLTGDLVIGDVGSSAFEEIDFAPTAASLGHRANFGWPACEGLSGSCPGATAPTFAYADSAPCNAVIGGYVYRGTRAPELAGRFLYTDLCHPQLRSLRLGTPFATDDRSEGVILPDSPVSFGEDSACDLYVAASNSLLRIVGSASSAAPACPKAKKKTKSRKRKRRYKAATKTAAGSNRPTEAKKKKRCKRKKTLRADLKAFRP